MTVSSSLCLYYVNIVLYAYPLMPVWRALSYGCSRTIPTLRSQLWAWCDAVLMINSARDTACQVLASQCDPLRFIIPFTTQAKAIVQKLWDKPRSWDDPNLPAKLLEKWKAWDSAWPHQGWVTSMLRPLRFPGKDIEIQSSCILWPVRDGVWISGLPGRAAQ